LYVGGGWQSKSKAHSSRRSHVDDDSGRSGDSGKPERSSHSRRAEAEAAAAMVVAAGAKRSGE
jgi:hypothetical protein